ncbi:MarR family transcriptional regulator [Alcaligenes ammonioxydans]|jgi:MarR family transcriptional repressor of emrRAB|uniref:MarR family winged helix-turn-helix transcriptional regulator n=1 Tax=Alcaligenes TaxID=507 RepID=UPI000269E1CB|nr:MarR family transcriptional regulator [Alcaligenes ammonioxydans]EJC65201.1 MarR family transcriptional regulator [Alcaligenes faecalis subsp. faecalis NCIB 8687]MCH1878050.1 MarR family transcriptional regulator [Alcaligenes ammonioxydans]WGQ34481.1 MarR family transcriptional regulator [Alcaligenes faecalis]HRK86372.1 MarR family transcriptional regulator [Alcaligenes faecalis]
MKLDAKYQALLSHARQQKGINIQGMELCFQLLSLSARIDRDCAALLAPHGLSEARFVLLFLLENAPEGMASHRLAERAGITRATVTTLVDGLLKAGLVQRFAAQADRRSVMVKLSPQGAELAKQLVATHARWIGQLFSHLSAAECVQLGALLSKAAGGEQAS